MGELYDEPYYDEFDEEEIDIRCCTTCNGKGTVNPLTAPDWFFCAGVADCPVCDGSGEMP